MPPYYNSSDREILRLFSEAIKASDTEAYEVLFRAEYENVKYFIRHYVHDGPNPKTSPRRLSLPSGPTETGSIRSATSVRSSLRLPATGHSTT